jgi:hypothetical protein
MCRVLMVVVQVSRHQPFEMPLIHDDHMVQQVAPATSHPSLGNAVLPRATKGRASRLASHVHHNRKPHPLQTLCRDRIARICVAPCRPMFLVVAVQPKAANHPPRGRQSPGRSQPWNLIARGFGLGTSRYPGFRFLHLRIYRISQFLVPETTLDCPQRSSLLAYLANRYLRS